MYVCDRTMDGCTLVLEEDHGVEDGCLETHMTRGGRRPWVSVPDKAWRMAYGFIVVGRTSPGGGCSLLTLLYMLCVILNALTSRGASAEKWIAVDGSSDELRVVEYCETEIFHAECPEDQVIVMRSANYGRMKFGRCVDRDYGYVGCSTDVLKITDKLCSGRHKCDVPVPNSAFRRTQPCPKDLKPYFEAEYTCVTVQNGRGAPCEEGRPILLTSSGGYLAKAVAEATGHGSAKCPWLVEAKPGQTISITLFDFSLADWPNTNAVGNGGVCHVTAVIRETTDPRGIRVCGGDGRQRDVYTTVTNAVEVRMLGPTSTTNGGGHYLLKYQVHGCADPEPPANAWLKRNGNKATLGCESLDVKWQLECKGNQWEGEVVGNCTPPTPAGVALGEVVLGSLLMPFGKSQVSLIIITAIAVAIGIIILSIGLICLRWRIHKRQCPRAEGTAGNKQQMHPQTNTYDGKSRRGHAPRVPGPQGPPHHNFPPPPPPEVDNEMLIQTETENEYAYIADLPPPPPPGGSHSNLSDNSSEVAAAAAVGLGMSEASAHPQVFHDFYPTTPTPYEQSPCPSPFHARQSSSGGGNGLGTPKLLAHECALAALQDSSSSSSSPPCGHYGQHHLAPSSPAPGGAGGGTGSRVRRHSDRSRLGSDGTGSGSDPPTYFELEPEEASGEAFSFVMHMAPGGPDGLGGHPLPVSHLEGPLHLPRTPPPPPTPPVAPPGFFKVSPNHNGHVMHHHLKMAPASNNLNNNNGSKPNSPHHTHFHPNINLNPVGQSPQHHHNNSRPGVKVGPKTAPKPKRHMNPSANISNRASMPLQFTNGDVSDGNHNQNTL